MVLQVNSEVIGGVRILKTTMRRNSVYQKLEDEASMDSFIDEDCLSSSKEAS